VNLRHASSQSSRTVAALRLFIGNPRSFHLISSAEGFLEFPMMQQSNGKATPQTWMQVMLDSLFGFAFIMNRKIDAEQRSLLVFLVSYELPCTVFFCTRGLQGMTRDALHLPNADH